MFMNDDIGSITQMTELIATAVEEQSCVSNEISQNIIAVSDVAYEKLSRSYASINCWARDQCHCFNTEPINTAI